MLWIEAPLSKSMTASTAGTGLPFGSVVLAVLVVTSSVTGVGTVFESFFGLKLTASSWVLPSAAVSTAAADAAIASAAMIAPVRAKVRRLRIWA